MDIAILTAVAAVLIIAVTSRVGPRWHVAAPLLLVLVGIGLSFVPFMPEVEVEPELVLAVVLPPLLYGSAVSMPAMNFRREFSAIAGLAVTLVIVSSVLLGFVFHLIVPSLELPWCIALGAILSPTDAVATSIARGVGISSRVTTILEGESLLNDATALVTLRTAVAAAAASFSLWEALGQFAYSVAVALVIGFVAGKLGVLVRVRSGNATVSAILSFTVPFIASVPTDLLQGSGLVAAVVAGIVTGRAKDRALGPEERITARIMWDAVTLVLESGVFLLMGLEMRALLLQHADEGDSVGSLGPLGSLGSILLLAILALVLMMLVRAAYVLPLVHTLGRNARRAQARQPRMAAMESAIMDRDLRRAKALMGPDVDGERDDAKHRLRRRVKRTVKHTAYGRRRLTPEVIESRWDRLARSTRRALSDIDYYTRQPLTMRDGTVMVAAGMRGAVTLAAAQTLPHETPYRSSLVLVAFGVAVLSLVLQGGTLAPLVRWVEPSRPDPADLRRQRQALSDALSEVELPREDDESAMEHKLRTIVARRGTLLDLQDDGFTDPECTSEVLASLDAVELGVRLRLVQEAGLTEDDGDDLEAIELDRAELDEDDDELARVDDGPSETERARPDDPFPDRRGSTD